MKVAVNMPNNIKETCTSLISLEREGLCIQNNQYISIENNVLNIGQLANLPWNIKLKSLTRNTNNTTFKIGKRQKSWIFYDNKQRGGTLSNEIQRGQKIKKCPL